MTVDSLAGLKELEGTPFLVLSNKADRKEFYTPIEEMKEIVGLEKIERSEAAVFSISALQE